MYAPIMVQCFRNALVMVAATWMLAACHAASQQAAAPTPEAEQVISDAVKQLYMDVSTAPPRSAAQRRLILRMAAKASNGKELLLVVRAGDGVLPEAGAPEDLAGQVRSTVTSKMIRFATLDQLINYAAGYAPAAGDTRLLVERMFELGKASSDPRVGYRIRAAAFHLRLKDLEQQAQARADALATR
jgi:hypothetical protein